MERTFEEIYREIMCKIECLSAQIIQRKMLLAKKPKGGDMLAEYKATNETDENQNPTGGCAKGVGLSIDWQNGPLGREEERIEPNGAFVETIIDVARQRIEFYQQSKFKCRENAIAITKLEEALVWLNSRTANREKREVEGTHTK